ncbi:hypothetical protein Xoosp13_71 [Xanthomonas phage Xoo-sp13]|nr:hypothetical protein Xoosp13_71 [Xanthomonas phage Xoo-sp13]
MEELTGHVRSELQDLLEPLLSKFSSRVGFIEKVSRGNGCVTIHTVEYFRGESYWEDINIPYNVWNAEDPVAEATKYLADKKATEEAAKQLSIQKEIDRLQKQLTSK